MARIVINPGADGEALCAWRQLADERLGPEAAGDARNFCPVDTGALTESIEHHLDGDDLIVSAAGGADGRTYTGWVEFGHRVYFPSTGTTGAEVVPAEPFLPPALFQRRGE
jgi:hypothetical protein